MKTIFSQQEEILFLDGFDVIINTFLWKICQLSLGQRNCYFLEERQTHFTFYILLLINKESTCNIT